MAACILPATSLDPWRAPVVLSDSSGFSEYLTDITLGTSFSFVFASTTNAPESSPFPDTFLLYLSDPNTGLTLLPTTDPNGANSLLIFNIDGTPAGSLTVYSDSVTTGAAFPTVHRERFDLDRVGSVQYGATNYSEVTQIIEGQTVNFDETDVTDVEILCYYAYSPLYAGNFDARKNLLDGRCGVAALRSARRQ